MSLGKLAEIVGRWKEKRRNEEGKRKERVRKDESISILYRCIVEDVLQFFSQGLKESCLAKTSLDAEMKFTRRKRTMERV